MIRVTESIAIDERELEFVFSRASGPGGQNVNKVATAVQLRFDVAGSQSMSAAVKKRLIQLAGSRMTRDGVLVINARRYRSQEQNRADAIERLVKLVRTASGKPKRRIETKPTRESRKRRLEDKRHRSETKRRRRPVTGQDE
jgi:ribosome-associated protein